MKKIAFILLLLLWVGGAVSGLILAIGTKNLVAILSVLVLVGMSYPTAKTMIAEFNKE